MNPSEKITLYVDLTSQPCRSVVCLAKMLEIPYEEVFIAFYQLKGDKKFRNFYKEVNPLFTIPSMSVGDTHIIESGTMARYLGAHAKNSKYYDTTNKRLVNQVEEFFVFYHKVLRPMMMLIFYEIMATPQEKKLAYDPKEALEITHRALSTFERTYLKGDNRKFILGDQFTVCDVWAFSEIFHLNAVEYDIRVKFPKVFEWLKRCYTSEKVLRDVHDDIWRHFIHWRGHKYWFEDRLSVQDKKKKEPKNRYWFERVPISS